MPFTAIPHHAQIAEASQIFLAVYDVAGRELEVLANDRREAGVFEVVWEGRDKTGQEVGSGVYFARLVAGDFTATRKMVLMR